MKFRSIVCATAAAAFLAVGLNGPVVAAEKTDVTRHVVCIEVYQPVCGRKGHVTKTYSNTCFAKADGAKVVALGPCRPSKIEGN